MKILIEISMNQTEYLPQDTANELLEQIEAILTYTFASEEKLIGAYEMDITFMNNAEIHEVNSTYRGIDRPTDVISFAFNDAEDAIIVPEGMEIPKILGELFISVEKAEEQAVAYDHTFQREILFLAVHGMLHLLGYDHETPTEEQEMFSRQNTILAHFHITR